MFNSFMLGKGTLVIPPTLDSVNLNLSSPWYTLNWTNVNPSWVVNIYRSVNGGSYSLIHTTSPGETSYSDSSANTYEDNSYYITHSDGFRESTNSNTISVDASTINLTIVAANDSQPGSCPGTSAENSISWGYVGASDGYVVGIEVSIDGGIYSSIASALPISPALKTHSLAPLYQNASGFNRSYTYRVSATKAGVHASNSPKITDTLNLTLDTCGV